MDGIKKLTYSEQVAEYIKQSILEGELSPGDQVKEVLLAEKLGISRAPIREALQILAREGLIKSEPQKGKHVSALTAKQIMDSYFTGGVLEAAAVTQALPLYTDEDISNLEQIVEQMREVAESGKDHESLTKLDTTFHNILFSRIDNELLIELCRRSCQGISKFLLYKRWINLYTPQQVYERHLVILEALKSGRPSRLEKTIRKHYTDSGKRMSKYGVDVHKG
ncbi:GntR family transcriptional regulator [Maridesulfovibrio salexigens]|uniref:Transcriptional regulator, GntR family n=1 Tax=Maridesulfovibrio salexigens (strain ATCC 14822 / DSM 2638 / NCIMB 8403 / VKM B-1763) TaxID=526222 RepID=C6BRK8_MARSD|nr:GntR family transcriptional regulator [Maridesulfovibrio salexigens]ACS79448.1 transcriptional regulator, GntR family [Maridesulfovibrio salexigens DSM 2638]